MTSTLDPRLPIINTSHFVRDQTWTGFHYVVTSAMRTKPRIGEHVFWDDSPNVYAVQLDTNTQFYRHQTNELTHPSFIEYYGQLCRIIGLGNKPDIQFRIKLHLSLYIDNCNGHDEVADWGIWDTTVENFHGRILDGFECLGVLSHTPDLVNVRNHWTDKTFKGFVEYLKIVDIALAKMMVHPERDKIFPIWQECFLRNHPAWGRVTFLQNYMDEARGGNPW